jgi:hypothetical protein
MTLREQLIMTSDGYCAFTGMSRSRLSTILLSGGKRLDMIHAGGDIGTARYESAMSWLSENWPAGLDWPDGVPRPVAGACREATE